MNKKDLKKLLEEVGGLRHYLNLLDSSESDATMSLTVGVWYHNDDTNLPNAMYVIPCYDDGRDYYQDLMSTVLISNPWAVGSKAARKYMRKFLVAEATKGREGLLDLLEKKNAALRRYLWEEVIEDQNP